MDLSENFQKEAARILGRDISVAEKGTVTSLDAFTAADLAEIRKLGKRGDVLAVAYICFRLKPNISLSTVGFYYSSVFKEGMSVQHFLELMGEPSTEKKSAL